MVGDDLDVVEPNISIRYVVESKAIGDVVFGKLAWGLDVEWDGSQEDLVLERSSSEKSTMSLGLQVERDRSPEDFGVAFELRKKKK